VRGNAWSRPTETGLQINLKMAVRIRRLTKPQPNGDVEYFTTKTACDI
jgi:hypothetical protein